MAKAINGFAHCIPAHHFLPHILKENSRTANHLKLQNKAIFISEKQK